MDGTFISIDLETTGLQPQTDQIIEVGLLKLVDGVITQTYQTLVNPQRKLSVKIKRLTQLDDDMLQDQPTIQQVLPEIMNFVGDYPLLGHNVAFDHGFLTAAVAQPIDNPLYDTLDLARIVLPDATNHRLGTLCQKLDIQQPQQHRALDDARGTALMAVKLVEHLRQLELPTLRDLAMLLEIQQSPWQATVKSIFSKKAKQFSDSKINSTTGLRPIQQDFEENFLTQQPEEETIALDDHAVEACLGINGQLSRVIPRYEHRPQQLAMAKAITNSLNKKLCILAEAGTGTGKSMAYLVPAVLWSQKNHQRIVISTQTINLQDQLWGKDLPLLQSLPGFDVKAALVKGRSNFICLRRWYLEINAIKDLKPREAGFYARILIWLTKTETGDRGELNLTWADGPLWRSICAESEGCLGKRCRYFYGLCFVNRMRRKAEQADVIIANHSLVLSDIKTENRVLPAYKVLIFDEAHHLADTATDHLGITVNKNNLVHWLANIAKIYRKLAPFTQWHANINTIKAQAALVREAKQIFFTQLGNFLWHKPGTRAAKVTVRLKENHNLSHLSTEIENLTQGINGLANHLLNFASEIEGFTLEGDNEQARELAMLAEQGLALATDITFICQGNSKKYVYWLNGQTYDHGHINISLHAVPIDVGVLLHSLLYTYKDSVIFTSATLTVDGSFGHFKRRSGVELIQPKHLNKIKVDSPFSYDNQSLLYVLDDLPPQRSVPEQNYLQAMADVIGSLARACQGRTLVLFTAHRALQGVYYQLKPAMEEEDILLLGHGIDGSRNRMVEEFKTSQRAVLFGAASFWEGIDVPGNALSCVVLVKLPFWPPTVPVVEARIEALKAAKLDGFLHFSLPEAVIKFKQGFGRLIRTKYDRGVVVVMDRRIIDKRYGRKFLNSLPVSTYQQGNKNNLLKQVKAVLTRTSPLHEE